MSKSMNTFSRFECLSDECSNDSSYSENSNSSDDEENGFQYRISANTANKISLKKSRNGGKDGKKHGQKSLRKNIGVSDSNSTITGSSDLNSDLKTLENTFNNNLYENYHSAQNLTQNLFQNSTQNSPQRSNQYQTKNPTRKTSSDYRQTSSLDQIIQKLESTKKTQYRPQNHPNLFQLTTAEVFYLNHEIRKTLLNESAGCLLRVNSTKTRPVKIVGDVHGQFHDLLRLFEQCGHPSTTTYRVVLRKCHGNDRKCPKRAKKWL